ncbi:MAG: aldo/keto reductase [Acidobacteria bacterium]|jgi:aryl-alcohol dehydrogenase-like predicted oxidoreductase|nr:aldo/keto reductase [Acidobacteriota bacterium]
METRELGQTGIRVSALAYGASPLGQEFGPVDVPEAMRAVRVALDLGITHIDTSPYYGRGMSEVLLGIALRDVPRDSYTLSTKLGRYDVDKFDFSARRVVESVDVSLHRLGVDHVDLMFCHDIEFVDVTRIIEETLPALRKVQEQGKVRFVGVSGYPLRILERVLEATEVDAIMSWGHYTLQNQRLADLLPRLEKAGVGVLNAGPLGQRLLSSRPVPDWLPASAAVREACRRAAARCTERGTDIAKLALQFAIQRADIATTVVSSARPDSVRQWMTWLEEPPDQELLAEVQAILSPVLNEGWISGRPENN